MGMQAYAHVFVGHPVDRSDFWVAPGHPTAMFDKINPTFELEDEPRVFVRVSF